MTTGRSVLVARLNKRPLRKCLEPFHCRSFSSAKGIDASAPTSAKDSVEHATASESTDVLIVGGGVVGCSLANQLAKRAPGLSIGLVEARAGPSPSSSINELPHPRSYALSPFSMDFLELGKGSESDGRLGHYSSMQVWESGHPASLLFNSKDIEAEGLGAVVEDEVIVRHLWDKVQESCQIFTNSTVADIRLPSQSTAGLANVRLESSQKDTSATKNIQTKLVIGADGANSIVRRHAGIPRQMLEYEQHALTFTVKLAGSHGRRAFQRFLPTGPIALLPTFLDDHSIVVWSTTPALIKEWRNNPDLASHVNSLLQEGPERVEPLFESASGTSQIMPSPIHNILYGVEKVVELAHYGPSMLAQEMTGPFLSPSSIESITSPQFAFPLSCAQVTSYTAPRLALAGDSAHSVHPMAGQGLNLGLQDAANLVDVISKAHDAGMDLSLFLDEYETSRKLQVSLTIGGIHALQRVFGVQNTPLKHLKSLGMNLVQNLSPLRRQLAHAACHGVGV